MSNVYHYFKRNLFFTVLLITQIVMSSFSDPAGPGTMAGTKPGVVFISVDTASPRIDSFAPTSANTGDAVRIFGKYFTGVTAVKFGDTAAASFFTLTDTQIVATVGRGASGNISVTTPYGTATKPGFIYVADTFPPVINYFTPDSGKTGTNVTISGAHFKKATKVRFGDTTAISFTVLNDSTITAKVGLGNTGNVSVTTPFGTGIKPGFVFIASDTILTVIKSFTPASATTGEYVRIEGKYFTGVTAVSFGGTAARNFSLVADSLIFAYVGPGATGNVSVTAPYGTATKPGFTYIADTFPPVINFFTPTSGKTGTDVTIYGAHFNKTTKVVFGDSAAISFTVLNESTIFAKVASGTTGNVSVTTPFGTATKPGFVFIPSDTVLTVINSFTPTSAKAGTMVTIRGKHLTGAPAPVVSFGGTPSPYLYAYSDSLIIAIVGQGASGNVSVTARFGTATKPGFTFIPDSSARIATVNTNAGTNEITNSSLVLYPNPAKTVVMATHPLSTHRAQLQVIDLTGKLIKTINVRNNVTQTKVPVTGLLTGVYKLVWRDGKTSISQTLLVK
jgi:hypothetical protein